MVASGAPARAPITPIRHGLQIGPTGFATTGVRPQVLNEPGERPDYYTDNFNDPHKHR